LSPVHTVAEKCNCRRCLAIFCESHFSATVWTGLYTPMQFTHTHSKAFLCLDFVQQYYCVGDTLKILYQCSRIRILPFSDFKKTSLFTFF